MCYLSWNSHVACTFRRCTYPPAPPRHADTWTDARPRRVQTTASRVHTAVGSSTRDQDELLKDTAMPKLSSAPRRPRQGSSLSAVRRATKARKRERRRSAASSRPWRPCHPPAPMTPCSHALLFHLRMRWSAKRTRTCRCDSFASWWFAREETPIVDACARARASQLRAFDGGDAHDVRGVS